MEIFISLVAVRILYTNNFNKSKTAKQSNYIIFNWESNYTLKMIKHFLKQLF